MGLRDFLMGAKQFEEGGTQFGKTAEDIRKQAAVEEIAKQSPDLFNRIRGGDTGAAATYNSLGIQAGQKDQMADRIAQYAFPSTSQSGKNIPYTMDEIRQLPQAKDKSEEDLVALSKASRAAQDAYFNQTRDVVKEIGVQNRSDRQFGLQTENTSTKQGTKAFDVLNKTQDAFRENDYKIKEINDAFKRKTSIDDNLVFNYIARQVGGEKGPLNVDDIQRVQGVIGFKGRAEELKAYFTGDTYKKLSPQQRDALRAIVENNAKNFNDKKAESYAQDLTDLYSSQPRLRDKDGNPTGILASKLNQLKSEKVPVSFDKNTKSFVVEKKTSTHTGDMSSLINSANSIKDPAIKQKWIGYLNSKKDFTSEEMAHLSEKLKAESGK